MSRVYQSRNQDPLSAADCSPLDLRWWNDVDRLKQATAASHNTASWLHFLDGLEAVVPAGEVSLILDALPLHWTLDTMLWNWGHPRFHFVPLPKAAAWLNLIEGFWKLLAQRALAGRDCRSPEEVDAALHAAVADWNRHPTPFLWGRPPRPTRQLKRTYVYRI